MASFPRGRPRRIGIVGGGVAGLAAAAAAIRRGAEVTLFEAKRRLGGRAGSFFDEASGRWIDLCQHIGLGCCTEWLDFCRATGVADRLRRDRRIVFLGEGGRQYSFAGTNWLPPPLHLAPAIVGMRFLSWSQRLQTVRTMRRLQLEQFADVADAPTIGTWLVEQGVDEVVRRRFFEPVLISALGETLERASLPMARKVLVDGFLATRDGYQLITPTCSLTELYDDGVGGALERAGVAIHRGQMVRRVLGDASGVTGIELADDWQWEFDAVVVALPWRHVADVLGDSLSAELAGATQWRAIPSAPISGIHLWFERPLTDLPHAAILDRLSQWIFAAPASRSPTAVASSGEHYYQVIVSASHALLEREQADVIAEVQADLCAVLPATAAARLLRWRIATERHAVFSVRPGLGRLRPVQRTAVPGLALAGDWTDTGWPATMEGAVRSGRAAIQALFAD